MAYLLATDGSKSILPDAEPKTLQTAVGGHIEVLTLSNGRTMVLNEEGKINNLPWNDKATAMTRDIGLAEDDYIAGNVVICEPGELK